MARTAAGEALTEAHRGIQTHLATGLVRDLATLWKVDPTDIRGTLEPFATAAAVITVATRRAAAAAAASYYTVFRQVEGVPGLMTVSLAADPPGHVLRGALFGAAATGLINARRRGASVKAAAENGFVKASGSAVQVMANGARETLLTAVARDPQAHGYQRITGGGACAFCQEIADRGIIAHDEMSGGFESHSHCGCGAEPAFA